MQRVQTDIQFHQGCWKKNPTKDIHVDYAIQTQYIKKERGSRNNPFNSSFNEQRKQAISDQ